MFTIEGHTLTLIILIKSICIIDFVYYVPFFLFRMFKGGTYNTLALVAFASAVSVFVTLQWLL